MDSTLRSNISVGLPLDLLVYGADTLRVTHFACIDENNEYFRMIRGSWGERLRQVFAEIPAPLWTSPEAPTSLVPPSRVHQPLRAEPAGETGASHPAPQSLAEDPGKKQYCSDRKRSLTIHVHRSFGGHGQWREPARPSRRGRTLRI